MPEDNSIENQVEDRLEGVRSAVIVRDAESMDSEDSFEEDLYQFDNLEFYQPGLVFHKGH